MPLAGGPGYPGLPSNPRRWQRVGNRQYMRVGYTTQNGRRRPVFRWVRIGSSFYKQLQNRYASASRSTSDARDRRPGSTRRAANRAINRSTLRLQRRLRKAGFKIEVDGISGPRTKSAYKAMQNGMSPKKWNRQQAGGGGHAGHSHGGGGGGRGGRGGRGGGRGGKGFGKGGAGTGKSVRREARAMTERQYGPLLDELERQQRMAAARGAGAKTDIAQWYGQVMDEAAKARVATEGTQEASEQDFETALGGISDMFGGSAGPQGLGGYAAAMRGVLEGIGQAESAFQADLQPIMAQQRTDALERTTRATTESLEEIAQRLVQAKREKGFAYTENLAKVRAQMMNEAIAQQEFGLRLAEFGLRSDEARRRRRASGFGGKVPWRKFARDPNNLAQLEERIAGQVTNPQGNLGINPVRALNAMGAAMRSMGYDPRKIRGADRWRDNLLRSLFHQSPGWSRNAWSIRGDGIYYKGKRMARL